MSNATAPCQTVSSSNHESIDSDIQAKAEKIQYAISKHDKKQLQELSVSKYGLVSTELRAKSWPILIGCHLDEEDTDNIEGKSSSPDSVSSRYLARHKDEPQVQKDVDRSFVHFPKTMSEQREKELKQLLSRLIVRMLREVPVLNYYQGYHDVASVVSIVYGDDEQVAFKFLYKLTLEYLRDHMLQDVYPTTAQLRLIPGIVLRMDRQLGNIVKTVSPVHAISAIITLFAHDLDNFDHVCLLWDSIFAQRDPALPLYLYSALLVEFKRPILNQLEELEPGFSKNSSCQINKDYIHAVLNRAVAQNLNGMDPNAATECIFSAITAAISLEREFPFTKMDCSHSISRFSCLRHRKAAAKMLDLQCAEVQMELGKRHRREKVVRRLKLVTAYGRSVVGSVGKMPLPLKLSLGVGLVTILIGLSTDRNVGNLPHWLSKAGKSTNTALGSILDSLRRR